MAFAVARACFCCSDASSVSLVGVADCSQASQTGDARDKFFAQPVPEFDPRASYRAVISKYHCLDLSANEKS